MTASSSSNTTDALPLPVPDLSGKVFLVTGGNSGIGLETVYQLSHQHAKVYIGCRSQQKGEDAIASIKTRVPDADLHLLLMDMMDLSSVVRAAKEFTQKVPRLHVLINNAGIMATPLTISADGYEAQLQTNYLAHWLLTHHLTPLLLSTAAASAAPSTTTTSTSSPSTVRIINVTSMGHAYAPKGGIAFTDMNQVGPKSGPWSRYGQSKLANILHARELARRYGENNSSDSNGSASGRGRGGIWTAATHPGNVDTGLSRNSAYIGRFSAITSPILKCLGVTIEVGKAAATPVFAATTTTTTSAELVSGSYLVPVAKVGKESEEAKDAELGKRLWAWTEEEMRTKGFLD